MKIKKYAAIDIGSNAIRLLVANIIIEKDKEPQYKKSSLVRVPIRLGADAFAVSYTHLTLPTITSGCRSRWGREG